MDLALLVQVCLNAIDTSISIFKEKKNCNNACMIHYDLVKGITYLRRYCSTRSILVVFIY